MKIEINQVNMQDLPEILEIEKLGFSPAEAGSREAFRERIEKLSSTFLVAKVNQHVVGFVVAIASREEYVQDKMYEQVPSNLNQGGHLLILSIATDPKYRGQGIGSQLLAKLEETARAAKRETISLDSLAHNISFYEHNGFKKIRVSQSKHAGEVWYSLVKTIK